MTDVTVVVINYNGIETVLDTIASVLDLKAVRPQVLVIDDGSTDGSPKAIDQRFPEVEVYREERNTKQLNRLRNRGLALAETRYVLLTDNDVEFDASCVAEMLRVIEAESDVGACIPRLMYLDDRSRLYHKGGRIHYVGASTAPGRDQRAEQAHAAQDHVPEVTVGGGIALFDTEKLERVGAFDEEYQFGWGCDGELHQRLLLAGYRCLYVPSAVGYHEHKPFDATRRYRARGQVHNRWRYLLTHYEGRTLLLATPALLVYELVQAAFFLMKGLPREYAQGTWEALRQLPEILERREEVQALRRRPDRDLLVAGPLYVRLSSGVAGRAVAAAVKGLSGLFDAYWRLIRPLLSSGTASPEQAAGGEGEPREGPREGSREGEDPAERRADRARRSRSRRRRGRAESSGKG